MEHLQNKVFIAIISILSLYALVRCVGRCNDNRCDGDIPVQQSGTGMEAEVLEPDILEIQDDTIVDKHVPLDGKPNKIVYWNRRKEFNDMNDTHLAAAQQIGIKPLASRAGIPNASRKLYLVCSNMGFVGPEPYVVDRLTHSTPYLVKEAADLLYEIGVNFQDSLRNKHLAPYSVVVTSVLRTDADVKSLSKRNVNASQRSVHCYGTTFDISYKRFVKLDRNAPDARDVDLIAVLGEVLRDLKINGRCFVKHEVKQACFHITARKRK